MFFPHPFCSFVDAFHSAKISVWMQAGFHELPKHDITFYSSLHHTNGEAETLSTGSVHRYNAIGISAYP